LVNLIVGCYELVDRKTATANFE